MKVGRIGFLNASPFYFHWDETRCPTVVGSPKELAALAAKGLIDAGPLPLVECWNLEHSFSPLESWGIAVRNLSRSVYLLSKKPPADFDGDSIGCTPDSATSVALCRVLLEFRYGRPATIREGFHPSDQGRLLIGDEALKTGYHALTSDWPYRTDLAEAWWEWQKKPFVFARWVVKKEMRLNEMAMLGGMIRKELNNLDFSIEALARHESIKLGLPAHYLQDYLKGFIYELGHEESQSISLFRDYWSELKSNVGVV